MNIRVLIKAMIDDLVIFYTRAKNMSNVQYTIVSTITQTYVISHSKIWQNQYVIGKTGHFK